MAKVQKKSCHCNSCDELENLKKAIFLIANDCLFTDSDFNDPSQTINEFREVIERYRIYIEELIADKAWLKEKLDVYEPRPIRPKGKIIFIPGLS